MIQYILLSVVATILICLYFILRAESRFSRCPTCGWYHDSTGQPHAILPGDSDGVIVTQQCATCQTSHRIETEKRESAPASF